MLLHAERRIAAAFLLLPVFMLLAHVSASNSTSAPVPKASTGTPPSPPSRTTTTPTTAVETPQITQKRNSALSSIASTAVNQTAICQSVSVNYISPGLPAQCLRTRSTASSESQSSVAAGTSTAEMAETGVNGASSSSTEVVVEKVKSQAARQHEIPTSTVASTGASTKPVEAPEEHPVDAAKFLSFEEWKAQNLARVGQSSDSFSDRGMREPQKAPGMGSHALDGLGDEIEIDLEFGSPGSPAGTIEVSGTSVTSRPSAASGTSRSKDAGKTCKERFNYASFDCAATVHKHNKESKGANSILLENKEAYMLNKCEAKEKFFIVELCGDILVDTVVLANFEFFSSVFKEIRVSVSDRYPVKANGWKELGTFVGKNTRDVQAFLVESPLIWARYVKVEILSHYGNEYYCPISLLRVHGTTMMEEFRYQEEAARGGFEEDVTEEVEPEAVAEPVKSGLAAIVNAETARQSATVPKTSSQENSTTGNNTPSNVTATTASPVTASHQPPEWCSRRHTFPLELPTCRKDMAPEPPRISVPVSSSPSPSSASHSAGIQTSQLSVVSGVVSVSSSEAAPQVPSLQSPQADASRQVGSHSSNGVKPVETTRQDQPKPSTPQPPIASPPTQESFFKSVHKRLTRLESNSTLSLQYIEEQSRLMRDTFAKMEKSHISKMEQLLEILNATAFADLRSHRDQYDQLWQSTVLALASQRSHSEREMVAVSTRLTLLADEVIFQKRMYQLNTILLVITIVVVIFSRNGHLAMPLGRHLRTTSSFRILESPPGSPHASQGLMHDGHRRQNSSDSASSFTSPGSEFPTLVSSREGSPSVETKSNPPTSKGKTGTERRNWINFGPKLKAEGRGRRWQRLPSPLGDEVVQGESGCGSVMQYFLDGKRTGIREGLGVAVTRSGAETPSNRSIERLNGTDSGTGEGDDLQ